MRCLGHPRNLFVLEAGADDRMMAQHLGIARLTIYMPIADVYDAVTGLDMAVDTAMRFVQDGERTKLGDPLLACPFTG